MDNNRLQQLIVIGKIKEIIKLLSILDVSNLTQSNIKIIYKVIIESLFIFRIVTIKDKNIIGLLIKSLYYAFNLLLRCLYLLDNPVSVIRKLDRIIFHLKLIVYSSSNENTDSGGRIKLDNNEIKINDTIRYY